MAPKRAARAAASKKKEFVWTDDEAELLLTVTHDYKIKHLVEGTCWESVRSKYADIVELFKKELPGDDEQRRRLSKDYPHKPEEIKKEILTTKLKAVRMKFREVSKTFLTLPIWHCTSWSGLNLGS